MVRYRRFNRNFLLLSLGSVVVLAAINYVIDPFNFFQTPFLKRQIYGISDRYTKIEFLKRNRQRFNSFILGSSRAFTINPKALERYIPGTKFYNLAVTSGTQDDNIRHFEYLLANKHPLHTLYVQIDIDALTAKIGETEYGLFLHPDVIGQNKYLMYVKYMTILPYKQMALKMKLNWEGLNNRAEKIQPADGEDTEPLAFAAREAKIAINHEEYIRHEATFHQVGPRSEYSSQKENLAALGRIKALCVERHIDCIFFTAPYYRAIMDVLNLRNYYEALVGIGHLTEFYDFSGYNTITLDAHNYYDASHYRPYVARLIAARIFNDPAVVIPPDFGKFVTKSNLDAHVADGRHRIEERERNVTRVVK